MVVSNVGTHGSRVVIPMAEYVDFELAKLIVCDMCTYAYPTEDCPLKCEWMELLKRGCKKDGE